MTGVERTRPSSPIRAEGRTAQPSSSAPVIFYESGIGYWTQSLPCLRVGGGATGISNEGRGV